MKTLRNKRAADSLSHGRLVGSGNSKSAPKAEKRIPARRKPGLLSLIGRWGLICILVVLAFGKYNVLMQTSEQARKLEAEVARWEQTQTELEAELNRFADPQWRESYWKWRTMHHEPGEYYIRFQDQQP